MKKLTVVQNNLEYHGFFAEPVFELMGDIRSLIKLAYKTFSVYGVSLGNFRLDGDASEPSSAAVHIRLGSRGIYKLKFELVNATLSGFDNEQVAGFFEMLQIANDSFREHLKELSFKSHLFFYTGHLQLEEGNSKEFLMSLPPRNISVVGDDLGSGIVQSWNDQDIGGKVSFTLDHSLLVDGALFVNYRVIIERDKVDYIPLAFIAQQRLYSVLANLGLEIDEGEQ